MTGKSRSYVIVDEPTPKKSEYIIVNPIVILLVAIFLPLFWNPPFFGRYWLPFVWIVINGFILGSPFLKREVLISCFAIVAMIAVFAFMLMLPDLLGLQSFDAVAPYTRIALNGTFFLFLYWAIFSQSTAWEIHNYIKENKS